MTDGRRRQIEILLTNALYSLERDDYTQMRVYLQAALDALREDPEEERR